MKSVLKNSVRVAFAVSAALSIGLVATTRAADDAKQPSATTRPADASKTTDTPASKQPETKPASAAKETGTVAGKVLGADGKSPAAGVKIRLVAAADAKPRKQADPAAAKPGKIPAVAEGEAGADGTFALADVPPGEYVVIARLKGEGNARQKVTVTAGERATVALTLKPAAAAAAAK